MSNGGPSNISENFKYVLYTMFINKFTAIGGVIAIALSFLSNYQNGLISIQYNNQLTSIPVGLTLFTLFVLLIFLVSLFSIAFNLHSNCITNGTPKVVRVYDSNFSQNPDAKAVFVLEPSNRFNLDIIVSIYYKYPDLETNIGWGVVQNIQENNNIQIEVACIQPGHESILDDLLHNNIDALKSIKVKPFVQRNELFKSSEEVLKGATIS